MAYEWITDALETTWSSIDHTLRSVTKRRMTRRPRVPDGAFVTYSAISWVSNYAAGRAVPAPRRTVARARQEPDWRDQRGVRRGLSHHSRRRSARALSSHHALAIERLRGLGDEEWEKVGWSPEGERPYHRFQETRVLDSWIHLQDIRDALLEPADDHGPGEEIVVNRFESALPFVLGKKAKAPEGTVVRINLTGRLARTVLLEVENGRASARSRAPKCRTLKSRRRSPSFGVARPGRISAEAFLRASATDVRGDASLALA